MSWARFCAAIDVAGVGDELFVDGVGQASFEAADGLLGCFAVGEFASVVGAALGVVVELDDGHDVQDSVDASVAGSGESMALVIAAGCVDGCCAVAAGEVVVSGDSGVMSATSLRMRAALEGPMPYRSSRPVPVSLSSSRSWTSAALILRSIVISLMISSKASWWRVLLTKSRGRMVASRAGLPGGEGLLGAARKEL